METIHRHPCPITPRLASGMIKVKISMLLLELKCLCTQAWLYTKGMCGLVQMYAQRTHAREQVCCAMAETHCDEPDEGSKSKNTTGWTYADPEGIRVAGFGMVRTRGGVLEELLLPRGLQARPIRRRWFLPSSRSGGKRVMRNPQQARLICPY